jgi:hypothetical protein
MTVRLGTPYNVAAPGDADRGEPGSDPVETVLPTFVVNLRVRCRYMTRLVCVFSLLIVLCSIRTRASQDQTSSPSLLEDLDRAEAKWKASKIEAYEFRFQYACNGLIRPEVLDRSPGRLLFRVAAGESRLWGPNISNARVIGNLVQYSTVEQMFDFIRRAWTSRPARLEVQYDEAHAYPTRVCIDPAAHITDDEYGFVTSDFIVIHAAR